MVAIVAVRAFGLAKGGFRYAERLASHDVALRVLAALRVRLWESLVRLGPAVTARLRTGELLARLTGDVEAQQDVVVRALVPAAAAALVGLGTAGALGVLLPAAGVTLAAALICAGLVAPAVTVRCARQAARRTAAARGARTAAVTELIECAPDLVAFGAADRRRRQVAALDAQLAALQRKAALATGLGSALTVLAIGGASVACTALGIQALRAGALPGTALAVLALTPLAAADLVAPLPEAARRLATALPAARRLAELDRTPAAVPEPADPHPVPPGNRLAADRLTVRWPGATRDAVRDVDLLVAGPTPVLLTGPSGCGKSTLVAAFMRTLDAHSGRVCIDDVPAQQITSDDLRTRIAWCGPAAHLFDSTLRENLLLARPGATDTDLGDALTRAGLGDWLAGLPEGLATLVGRHGGTVSGGERQRIGLARVLLADRPILLLDEPTAHLDADTAAVVYADLLRAAAGRATLIVTHRPDDLPGLPRVALTAAAERRPSAVR
jgi:ATP-binding cassette subfamily C protein CydCD